MKINAPIINDRNAVPEPSRPPAHAGTTTAETACEVATRVALSPAALELAAQGDCLDNNPLRLQALRQAIMDGSLRMNAARIADGLIASVARALR